MKTELDRFNETVGILVKAYLNDTLRHGNCTACAVGNMIAAYGKAPSSWIHVFVTLRKREQRINLGQYYGTAKDEIDVTGYTPHQLARIEHAFELCAVYSEDDKEHYVQIGDYQEQMFNGLMAVVDVLADIHGINLEVKESAKLQFVK